MSKLIGRRVKVVKHNLPFGNKIEVGMVGVITEVNARHAYPVRVVFTMFLPYVRVRGKVGFYKMFHVDEVKYLNNKEIKL